MKTGTSLQYSQEPTLGHYPNKIVSILHSFNMFV